MGKSVNSPDMHDCCLYLCDIEQSTGCSATILLERGGYGAGSHWLIHVLAVRGKSGWLEDTAGISVAHRWPHRDHRTFGGALYCALAELDKEIARLTFTKELGLA